MASVNDWAAKAARRIRDEYSDEFSEKRRMHHPTEERIAAIIATFAEPMLKLLQESRREHEVQAFYCCDAISHLVEDGECTCGADEWNRRIDKVLNG